MTAIYHHAVSQYGISDNEFWVWYALLAESEPSQQSICEMWSLSKQTVNSIIYSMKRKGLVYLERIPHTRNKKIIRLTQTGRKYGNIIIKHVYAAEQHAVDKLTLLELQNYIELLAKYITYLREGFDKVDVTFPTDMHINADCDP